MAWRAVIAIAWSAVALAAVLVAAIADDELHRTVASGQARAVVADRRRVIQDNLQGHLVPGLGGLPNQYQITLYGPSPDGRYMIPLYPRAVNTDDPAIFRVGTGATGKAWEEPEETFVVKGRAVWDATHDLTKEQSRRYGSFEVAAATVIGDEQDVPLGVLTAIARDDDGFFDSQRGVEALEDLADGLAWLMPDAAEWMSLREEDVDDT